MEVRRQLQAAIAHAQHSQNGATLQASLDAFAESEYAHVLTDLFEEGSRLVDSFQKKDMISAALETPKVQQVRLQLQMKNCAVNRFIFTPKGFYLHGFNESPHITQETDHFLTYS